MRVEGEVIESTFVRRREGAIGSLPRARTQKEVSVERVRERGDAKKKSIKKRDSGKRRGQRTGKPLCYELASGTGGREFAVEKSRGPKGRNWPEAKDSSAGTVLCFSKGPQTGGKGGEGESKKKSLPSEKYYESYAESNRCKREKKKNGLKEEKRDIDSMSQEDIIHMS